MLNKTVTDKALNASDPIGVVASGVFVILSSLGFAEKYGLTADEVLMLVGGVGVVATGIRGWLERGRRIRVMEMLEGEPKEITSRGDEGDGDDEEKEEAAVPDDEPETVPDDEKPILPPPPTVGG